MKTIIVATDFSYNANNALEYAGALAAYAKSKIILFNAYHLPIHASNTLLSPTAVDELLEANKQRLERLAFNASIKYNITIECRTQLAIVTDALGDLVEEVEADLVVMGMHANDWSDRLLGNTTTAIIRIANFPVLVVPENASFTGIEKILYAFDTDCLYVPNKLSLVKDFARNFKAEVQVFHVEGPNTSVSNKATAVRTNVKVEAALSDVDYCYKDVEDEDVAEGIEKGIEEFGANLLVMVPHRLSFWEGLLNQSTTRTMALRTHIPLLVLPNPTVENFN